MASHSAIWNVILCQFILYIEYISADEFETHHTSCLSLDDGEHYIRPAFDDYYPSILVRCHQGWTIMDYTLDSNIQYYFSSWQQFTSDTASMDTSFERKNWNHWLQVHNVDFSVSDDCQTCLAEAPEDYNKAYYMTGNYYGCSFATNVLCDMDTTTNQCYQNVH